jgi:tRNA 2-thiouridine synthesizing protein A
VDAVGLLCPIPLIRLAEKVRALPPGGVARLLTDDPAAEEDVRLWCRSHGHKLLSVEVTGPVRRIRVRRSA